MICANLLKKVEERDVLEEQLDLLVGDGDGFILQRLAHFAVPEWGSGNRVRRWQYQCRGGELSVELLSFG